MLTDFMCQEKKEEENLPAFKIASIQLEDYIENVVYSAMSLLTRNTYI